MPCTNLQSEILPRGLLLILLRWFEGLPESLTLWIDSTVNQAS